MQSKIYYKKVLFFKFRMSLFVVTDDRFAITNFIDIFNNLFLFSSILFY